MAVPEIAILFFMPCGTIVAAPALRKILISDNLYNAVIQGKPPDTDVPPAGVTGQRARLITTITL